MATTTDCASLTDLQRYLADELSPAERAGLAAHLQDCPVCAHLVHTLQTEGQTIPPLTAAVNTPEPGDLPIRLSVHRATYLSRDTAADLNLDFLAPAEAADEIGRLGDYRALGVLGVGGMGVVFEAEDRTLRRRVALKVLRPELTGNAAYRQRFLREAQAMAAITHDHIIPVYQVGTFANRLTGGDLPYLAMPLLAGETLERRLDRLHFLPVPEVLRIGREVAEGLAAAHAVGLVHRDVKPANVWLEAPKGRVKILDFGLAHAVEGGGRLSNVGQILGTPQYMAPEQARGDLVSVQADLYSLGALLYHLLTGRPPFDGKSVVSLLTALAIDEPRPVTDLAPGTPAGLAALVHRLLKKDPAERLGTASEVADRILALERGTPGSVRNQGTPTLPLHPPVPTPRPTPVPGRGGPVTRVDTPPPRRRPRRRQWPQLVVFALVALVVGGLVGALVRRLEGAPPRADNPPPAPPPPAAVAPIVVGLLYSTSGPMRAAETPVLEMTAFALDDLNAAGGLLGRPVRYALADGASEETLFARAAENLIAREQVRALFGCGTSASRKAVKAVVEGHDHLLFSPAAHEGLELSPNVVYAGAVPNQVALPALEWCARKGFRRYFLVGTEGVCDRGLGAILGDRIQDLGGTLAGAVYLRPAAADAQTAVSAIRAARPDVILNALQGEPYLALVRALRQAGVWPQDVPTVSLAVTEEDLANLSPRDVAGDYVAASYFEDVPGERNQALVDRFRQRYGQHRRVTAPMAAAYLAVQVWAQAVWEAGSADPAAVRRALHGQALDGPQGPGLRVDPVTLHAWNYFRLGRVTATGQIEVVAEADTPAAPEPFPPSRPREAWDKFLGDLYRGWGDRWRPVR